MALFRHTSRAGRNPFLPEIHKMGLFGYCLFSGKSLMINGLVLIKVDFENRHFPNSHLINYQFGEDK